MIAPTIHNQVHHLRSKGIPATFLCSTQRDHTTAVGISAGEYKVVYVTPERLFPGGSQPDYLFQSLALKGKICLIAVDEAHCIFTWQFFRYDFVKHDMAASDPGQCLDLTLQTGVNSVRFCHQPRKEYMLA